jgi:uncharacterized protein (TIGR02996 family)
MTDDDFIQAIVASPDDDELRLVYADWLEEQGDPRGDYLRLAVALEKVESALRSLDCGNKDQRARQRYAREKGRLLSRLRELLLQVSPDWVARMHRGRIEHCSAPFHLWDDGDETTDARRCPGFWQRLQETASASVRFCCTCSTSVRYCRSESGFSDGIRGHGPIVRALVPERA